MLMDYIYNVFGKGIFLLECLSYVTQFRVLKH